MDGTVRDAGGQYELRFERHLKHPVEKVWAALTDPEHRDQWLALSETAPRPVDRDVALNMTRPDDRPTSPVSPAPARLPGTVRTIEPPRLLEYSWTSETGHEEPVRWELFPDADGTRLVLTHTVRRPIPRGFGLEVQNSVMTNRLAGSMAGWHAQLNGLRLVLAGQPCRYSPADWAEQYLHYLKATSPRVHATRPPMPGLALAR
jgi:uncharacterized protein YndB with AHSA1/START domain